METMMRKGLFILAVAGLLAILAGCSSGGDGAKNGSITAAGEQGVTTTAEAQPPRPFLVDLATGEMTPLAESIASAINAYVPSPDGTRLVYECDAPCSPTAIYVANIDGSGVRTIEPPKGLDADAARWSPDGTKLVYQERREESSEFGNLVVEDLASGRRTQVVTDFKLSGADWWYLWPRFNADGRSVIFHFPRHNTSVSKLDVWSVPVSGGKPKLVLRDASWPVPFPDGKSIAYVPGARGLLGATSIAIADAHGSRPRTLVEIDALIEWPSVSPDGSKIAYATSTVGGDYTIHVVNVATGEDTEVAKGSAAEWLDDDTLIIKPN